MFAYEKKLQYPVKIKTPNPKLASVIISQYGGPDGELGASGAEGATDRHRHRRSTMRPYFCSVFFQSVQHICPFGGQ